VFRHEGAKNSSSSSSIDPAAAVKARSKSLSTAGIQQQAVMSDAVTSSNCDASGDVHSISYDQSSGLSPWLVTGVNCAANAAGRKPTQSTRSTTAFPLTTEL